MLIEAPSLYDNINFFDPVASFVKAVSSVTIQFFLFNKIEK